jgi:hypothetical protein
MDAVFCACTLVVEKQRIAKAAITPLRLNAQILCKMPSPATLGIDVRMFFIGRSF